MKSLLRFLLALMVLPLFVVFAAFIWVSDWLLDDED